MNAAIATSLERLVETLGDPQPQIYQRLYAQYPDTKALFVLDTDGGVRGSMLQTTLETILDYAAKDRLDDVGLAFSSPRLRCRARHLFKFFCNHS